MIMYKRHVHVEIIYIWMIPTFCVFLVKGIIIFDSPLVMNENIY